jgi:hypothetical protein
MNEKGDRCLRIPAIFGVLGIVMIVLGFVF